MYSAYNLNKQSDNIQPWRTPFPIWNQSVVPCPVLTVASWPAYRFLKRRVRLSGIPISFKIFQARLQEYVNRDLPDVQAGFRKDRGTRDQIANICSIMEEAREFQKNIYFCFIDYAKAFDCVDHNKPDNSERDGNTRPPDLPLEKPICRLGSNNYNWTWNNTLVPNRKRSTSRLYIVTLLI